MNKTASSNANSDAFPRVLVVSLKSDTAVNIAPPTGLFLLKAHLNKNGIECDIVDRDLEGIEPYLDRINDGYYQIIGFSVSRIHMIGDVELIWEIKSSLQERKINSFLIGGGQEATSNARQWLDVGLDLIFKGFCERELVEFCKNLTAGDFCNGLPSIEQVTANVQGIAYKKGDEYIERPAPRFGVEQLTELCYTTVINTRFPYEKYWAMLDDRSADTNLGGSEFFIENVRVYTTSHCPRQCGFCSSQSFLPDAQGKQSPIVMLNAQQVADLVIMYVQDYGAKSILFSDDDFPVGNREGLERMVQFCNLMLEAKKEKKIPESLRFSCQARVFDFLKREDGQKVVNWDLIKLMRKAGFMSIGMGIETYSDRILKAPSINKIGITAKDCHNVIGGLIEVGLVPQTNLILGIPEYTVDELVDTLETAFRYIRNGVDVAITAVMNSMPGAPIHTASLYKTIYRQWTNPYTGETLQIDDYFEPQDPIIRDGISQFRALGDKEIEEIRAQRGWGGKILHKRVIHVCNLIGVARGIKRHDVADGFRKALEDIMDGVEGSGLANDPVMPPIFSDANE
ncbi:MAG: radical SAM protein [Mariprofundaceae bacterium]|nr:radical SAM protein [Mariprofundaceae bacterium]